MSYPRNHHIWHSCSRKYFIFFLWNNVDAKFIKTHWVNLAFKWIYLSFLALQVRITGLLSLLFTDEGASLSSRWVIDPRASAQHTQSHYGKYHDICSTSPLTGHNRVYAFMALYLLICSFWLTAKAFSVRGPRSCS